MGAIVPENGPYCRVRDASDGGVTAACWPGVSLAKPGPLVRACIAEGTGRRVAGGTRPGNRPSVPATRHSGCSFLPGSADVNSKVGLGPWEGLRLCAHMGCMNRAASYDSVGIDQPPD